MSAAPSSSPARNGHLDLLDDRRVGMVAATTVDGSDATRSASTHRTRPLVGVGVARSPLALAEVVRDASDVEERLPIVTADPEAVVAVLGGQARNGSFTASRWRAATTSTVTTAAISATLAMTSRAALGPAARQRAAWRRPRRSAAAHAAAVATTTSAG
jgi:hypothetical protein